MLKAWSGPFLTHVLPHWRHHPGQRTGLPVPAQCGVRGRLLAGTDRGRGAGDWARITQLARENPVVCVKML